MEPISLFCVDVKTWDIPRHKVKSLVKPTYFFLLLPLIVWISLGLRINMPFLKRPICPVGAEPEPEDVVFWSLEEERHGRKEDGDLSQWHEG